MTWVLRTESPTAGKGALTSESLDVVTAEAVSFLIEHPAGRVTLERVETVDLPVCRSCLQGHFLTMGEVAYDDEPRVCALCGQLRRPLYAVPVHRQP